MKYISIINSFYPNFSKSEKKIADYFLKEEGNISYMSLQEITKNIKVSEATIVRFVRKMGYKGFIDFKLDIAKNNSSMFLNNSDCYIENIMNNIFKTVSDTKELITKENIDTAISYLEEAKHIYIFGLGASGVAATEMENKFLRYGLLVSAITDDHFQTMHAATTTKNDLIIAISLSGETRDLIYSLKIAKENNCKILAITNHALSSLSKLADLTILTAGKETPLDGGSLTAKISQLYIIDILTTGYAIKNRKKALANKEKIALSIASKNTF